MTNLIIQPCKTYDTMLWPAGEITVKFLNGETKIQDKIKEYAEHWFNNPFGKLSIKLKWLDFSDEKSCANIRIVFGKYPMNWTRLGIDANYVSEQNEPTMYIGAINQSDIYFLFGSALGLLRERAPNLVFNKWQVITELELCGLSEAQIRTRVLEDWYKKYVNCISEDPKSVMHHFYPTSWTNSKYNTIERTISDDDYRWFVKLYTLLI